jgi:ribosome-associated heat shock protein Hsp15
MSIDPTVRLDRWLWAARFFKTRSLAAQAIDGGHVQVGGQRVKPARGIKVGDKLRVLNANGEFVIAVLGLSEQRGAASVAQGLYAESTDSITNRQRQRELYSAARIAGPELAGRPTKKWRRALHRFEQINQPG